MVLTLFRPLLVAALVAAPALAQDHPNHRHGTEVPTSFVYDQLDAVNLFNGNLTLSVPIGGSYPVGGSFAYSLALTYNSIVWEFEQGPPDLSGTLSTTAIPDRHWNAGMGWTLSFGRLWAPNTPDVNDSSGWLLVEPDGTRRGFLPRLHPGDPASSSCLQSPNQSQCTELYSRDGSYLRMLRPSPGAPWSIESPDGTIREFDASGRVVRIRDRPLPGGTANELAISYGANVWTLEDNRTGDADPRTHTVEFHLATANLPQRVKRITLAASGGNQAVYNFGYSTPTVPRHVKHSSEGLPGGLPQNVQVALLTSLTLPDGRSFTMDYFLDNETAPPKHNRSAVLARLKLPTRGAYEWDYGLYGFPGFGPPPGNFRSSSEGVLYKRLYNPAGSLIGTWEYWQGQRPPHRGPPADPQREVRTWVKTPEQDVTVHYFTNDKDIWWHGLPFAAQIPSGEHFLSQETFEGAQATSLIRSEWVRFTADQAGDYATDRQNQRLEKSLTRYHDDSNRFASVSFSDFDGLGHYRTRVTDGNFGAGDVRTTVTHYDRTPTTYDFDAHAGAFGANHDFSMIPASTPWVLDIFDFRSASEGTTEKTQFEFDAATGFLSSYRIQKGSSPGNSDVLVLNCPDARRNVVVEAFFGGDIQSLASVTPSCSPSGDWQLLLEHTYSGGSRASSRFRKSASQMFEHYEFRATIDPSTGLPSDEYDRSGYQTKYTYDSMGRIAIIEPWGSTVAERGAKINYTYLPGGGATGPRIVIDTLCPVGATCSNPATFGQTTLVLDGFGRLMREQVVQPDGTVSRKRTWYNAMGWKTAETEIGSNTDDNPTTSYQNHDPFGRPRDVIPADGAGHKIELSYAGVREVNRKVKIATTLGGSETSFTSSEIFDRQGRLATVYQNFTAGGNNLNTVYSYDVGNRLAEVRQTFAGTTQVRAFVYDGRGFLVTETHPEKSGAVAYSSYDARGNAGRRDDGSASRGLLFTYDKAGRLTQIAEAGVGGRLLKQFAFGTSGKGLAKVEQATRYNYFPALGVDVKVTETYGYGGPGWRPTSRSTQLHYLGANQERFDQSFSWNRDGTLASQGYPRCFAGGCGSGVAPRTVAYSYSQGFLTAANGFGSFTYHENGQVDRISHANGVTVTIANDPSKIRRPAEISVAGPGWAQTTGAYAYDGAGNVKAQGPNRFAYDGASRLTVAEMGLGGQINTQSYALDAFGNIGSITTNGLARNTPTSGLTNRLTGLGVAYDAAGNLTAWTGNSYEYDRLNMLTRRTAGAEDWVFVYTADDERLWSYRTAAGGHVVTLRDLDGRVLRRHDVHVGGWGAFTDLVYRGNDLLATVDPTGAVAHAHNDHLGTPRILTDAAGQATRYYAYYPFGEELFPALDTQPMRFTGHERDLLATADTADDHDYLHARSTNPLTARFLATDKAASWNPAQPQSWNRYSYALNGPVNLVDPDGGVAVAAAVWAGYELAATGYDFYSTTKTMLDEDASFATKATAVSLLVAGVVGPGGGFSGRADDIVAAGKRLAQNYVRGKEFEAAARAALKLAKNDTTFRLEGFARGTIPDSLTKGVTEIKSSLKVWNTTQLRLQARLAEIWGVPFNLVVSPRTTTISPKLLRAIEDSGGSILVYDPLTGSLSSWNHLP